VLTKPIGTGFITTAYKAGACPEPVLAAAVENMIQLNDIGAIAAADVHCHAATDITGFGLVGHAAELAEASHVTIRINLEQVPLLPGAESLAEQGYQTRAINTNRNFAESLMRVEGTPAAQRLACVFEAETSGGLLLSVAADRSGELVDRLRIRGAASAAVIGEVLARQDVTVIIRG
jgi:selenide,water dikinase